MHRNRTRTHDPLPTFDPTRLRRQLPKYYGRSIDHIGWLEVDLSLRSSIAVDKAAQGCSFAIHTAATANVSSRRSRMSTCGRVEMWRGSSRFGLSVAASFVWRCPNNLTLTPFPHPAHRTGHADLPHPALGRDITPSYTAGSQPGTSQTHETEVPVEVLGWISPAPATSNLVLVA